MIARVEAETAQVEQLARDLGFDEWTTGRISLAVQEAVANALIHGGPARRVDVAYTIEPDRLVVRIRDHGPGFDPSRVPDPRLPENLTRASGRGLLLMSAVMDEVAISACPGGGTLVKLTKRYELSAATSASA